MKRKFESHSRFEIAGLFTFGVSQGSNSSEKLINSPNNEGHD
jgi:hypothetical protein